MQLFKIYISILNLFLLARSYAKPPNILIIVADDYGWNDIGYHGSEIRTPQLDTLASEGVKLESYYVQPVCTPTRSQLMTGRYQIHTGLQHEVLHPMLPKALPIQFPTLADKLKDNGYSTHMVGKWHLGYYKEEFLPTNRGFDTFFGYLNGAEDYYTHRRDEVYSQDGKKKVASGLDFRDNLKPVLDKNGSYSAEVFADRAVQIVRDHAATRPDTPLFLYLPFQSVHSPLQVPPRYTKPYSFIKNRARRTYAGMVAAMDEAVGNVTAAFQQYGLWNETLLIFTTDNGGQVYAGGNNWPLKGGKTTLWEGGIRGVGFVRGSMLKRARTSTHELLHVSDWLPTVMTAIGASTTDMKLDGLDQWKTISEGAASARTELLHNIDPKFARRGHDLQNQSFASSVRAAIRVGDWKLLTGDPGVSENKHFPVPTVERPASRNPLQYSADLLIRSEVIYETRYPWSSVGGPGNKQNVWLYNVKQDPYENNELAAQHPDIVTHLLGRLAYYNSTAVPCVFPHKDPHADPRYHGDVWGPWQ